MNHPQAEKIDAQLARARANIRKKVDAGKLDPVEAQWRINLAEMEAQTIKDVVLREPPEPKPDSITSRLLSFFKWRGE